MSSDRQSCRVYLAGGFHSRWQQTAKARLTRFEVLDPSQHHLQDPRDYTNWDLSALRGCDILLGNMESSNPGGYALALEIGYAKALGKVIYLVDGTTDLNVKKYFEMVRQCADHTFDSLDEALRALEHVSPGASHDCSRP